MMKTLVLMLAAAALAVGAADLKSGKAGKITIDGILCEDSWKTAAGSGNFQLLKAKKSGVPDMKTEFKVLADSGNLYFGIMCSESEMSKLRCDLKGKPANPWSNDLIELFVAPTGVGDEYYQFVITAGGAVWTQYYGEHGKICPDPYDPDFEYAVKRNASDWTVELKIPFSAFYMTPAGRWKSKWLANIARLRHAQYQNSTWSALRNGFHDTDLFNTISGIPAKPSECDLLIRSASFATSGKSSEGYSGTLSAEVVLNQAPEGLYTLEAAGKKASSKLEKGSGTLEIKDVLLKNSGLNRVKLTLRDAAGKIVASRGYPVRIDPRPLVISFTSPQYGGNFYPGDDRSKLEGTVKVNIPAKEIVLEAAGRKYALRMENGMARFSVPLTDSPDSVEVRASSGNESVSAIVRTIGSAKAWIRNGSIILNGSPTFLLGWYGAGGFVMSKALLERYPAPGTKHPVNLPARITAEPGRLLGGDIEKEEVVFDRVPSGKVFAAYAKMLERNRTSPLFVYYLADEPECRGLSPVYLEHLYRFIKQKDPTRLVMIVSREPLRYLDCADIITPHPYISPSVDENGKRTLGISLADVRDMCRSVADAKRPDKALMLCPQVHSYAFHNAYAVHPTFDEFNLCVWASVCEGGQGICPYIYYEHFARPGLNFGADYVYTSLNRLGPLLASAETKPLTVSDSRSVAGRLVRTGENTLLILANTAPEKREVEVSSQALNDVKKLFRFRSSGEIVPENGKLKISLAPCEALILTSKKMDSGLETLESVRARIAKAEHERSHRGNILFGAGRSIELSSPPSRPYDLQSSMEQQDKLFDGICDVSAWMPRNVSGNLWYELAFTKFTPRFSKARIYGNNLAGMTFRIWKFGKWITPEAKRTDGRYSAEFDFGKLLSTVKIRLDFQNSTDVELYEFELLK